MQDPEVEAMRPIIWAMCERCPLTQGVAATLLKKLDALLEVNLELRDRISALEDEADQAYWQNMGDDL